MKLSIYVYVCSGGETFDSIARELWRDEKYAAELICANPEYSAHIMFSGGEELRIPLIELPADDTDNTATNQETAPWRE